MGFGSFFKKKKKQVEKGVSDVENMIKPEQQQPESELEKMDHSFTAEKTEPGNSKKGSVETERLQGAKDNLSENNRLSDPESVVFQTTVKEVTVNINSELLRQAQAKGVDLSNILEQQLRKLMSDTQ
ncbi:MAG: type II toxin-antitoxin system CcdA family antitoxin [Nitrososphaeraceae archaeon]